jgi:inorganic triphosphatase YgiF
MGGGLETELKLRAEEGALEGLAIVPSLGPATLLPAREVEELDVYLDTADGRLAAARWACRLRSREGRRWISLKGPAEHRPGESLHLRPEVEGPVPDDDASHASHASSPGAWPESPARDLVLQLVGDATLAERLSLRQRRVERQVIVDGGRVGLMSLDRVTVLRHGETLGSFGVAELELDDGEVPAPWLAGLAEVLTALPGVEPEPMSKLERALELAEVAGGEPR